VGTISIIIRGVLLPKLIRLTSERRLEQIGVISMTIGLVLSAIGNSWPFMLLAVLFFAAGTGLTRPLMMGDISRSVDEQEQGAIMGVAGSINSLGQIIGPLVGGFMLSTFFTESHIFLSISVALCSVPFLQKATSF
jgi:DHA1 family tetracycline resistance protein-like MFS transporter